MWEKSQLGLTRPVCLSRFGRAASVSVPPASLKHRDPQPPTSEDTSCILHENKTEAKPSAVFRSVSRRKAQEVARHKTVSPDVGRYDPNYHVGKLRTDHSPQFKGVSTSPREKRILLPPCLSRIEASYPRHDRKLTEGMNGSFDAMVKRTVSNLKNYSKTICMKETGDSPRKPEPKLKGLVTLKDQLNRPEFVDKDGPPSAHRFSFKRNDSLVLSTTKRLPDISFSKSPERPELFRPSPLPDYRPNTRLTHRHSPQPLDFGRQPGRKSLALGHLLRNPPQGDQKRIDKGWGQLQTRPKNLPTLQSATPRDDLMYRTNEQYKLNVPRRQLAMDVPVYQGEFKDAFRGSKTSSNISVYICPCS